jgi:hypothetical protein
MRNADEALQALRTKILQPHALLDKPDVFMFQESNSNVFLLVACIQQEPGPTVTEGHINARFAAVPCRPTSTPAARIVFRVHGICKPTAELTCQFAGVLQSNVDEMVQRRIATILMRHRHLKLSPSDVDVIAPPQAAPGLEGTISIPARFVTAALPLYIERALQKLFTPLRVGGGADSREQSPVMAAGKSGLVCALACCLYAWLLHLYLLGSVAHWL